ncbi:hypothetical protein [Nocardia callitridis]|uniref:Uncharacterized protein n=1 Tax=Nocardia callitridis TaxID=648753 RepID=A0ABP9KYF5_9NOCA
MSYSADIESAIAECQRRSRLLLDEFEDIQRKTAATSQRLTEESIAAQREFLEEHREEIENAQAEAAEKERLEVEERERQDALAAEAREQREAIARSIAARKANDVVAPIDDEDEEAAFYQRKSWLI